MLSNHDISTDILKSNRQTDFQQLIDTFFLERPFYPLLLECLGLREIKDGSTYILSYRDTKNWNFNLDEVSNFISQQVKNDEIKSKEIVTILDFILKKLDRNRYVPAYVRSFMCRNVVKRAVLQKFSECLGRKFANLEELSYHISDNITEANEVFDSLRICDPAIGSGSFFATILNVMIAMKSQLGILADKDGNPLYNYKINFSEEELSVIEKTTFDLYQFHSTNPESFRIHETLFLEKKNFIEECLFGVDIDSTAVSISKFRLWIELIKHTCWSDEGSFIIPRFECNIKTGDSLVNRFSLNEDLRSIFKRIGCSPLEYKKMAQDYKLAVTKEERNRIGQHIAMIKKKMQLEISWDDRNNEELLKWERELAGLKSPSLFEMDDEEIKVFKNKLFNAQSMVEKYKQKIEDVKNNPNFNNAIEWRYEFPELLNELGDFVGFDIVIGNPPDTQSQLMTESIDVYKYLNYNAYKRTGDVSSLFYELGSKILKTDYFLSFITSNSWMKSVVSDKMRQYLMEATSPLLMVEFSTVSEFDHILSDQAVVLLQKSRNIYKMLTCQIKNNFSSNESCLEDYVDENSTLSPIECNGNFSSIASFSVLSDNEKQIKNKIEQIGIPLESWDIHMYSGIKTGYDSAFIIDGKTKDEFVLADYKNIDIIKPLLLDDNIHRYLPAKSDLWLIYIPWHFPLLYDTTIKSASERAELRFKQQYPVIYEYILKFKDKLISRDTPEVGVMFEWYALQRFGTSSEKDDFSQQKIVWKREATSSNFCFDYSGCAVLETMCFITGQHLKYLLGVLNSKLGKYMLQDSPRLPNGDMQISILTLESLKIPVPNIKIESELISLVNKRTTEVQNIENEELDKKIDQLVYDMYELTQDERGFIDNNISYD